MLGPDDADYRVEVRDVTEGIDEADLDRVLLDLPEPWRVVPHAAVALRPGGILLAYLPTINQTAQLREALDDGPFGLAETVEILRRTWHVETRSVRPDHRMVAHTGFLTTARLLPVVEAEAGGAAAVQSRSMKMHSPGHSSEASTTASSRSSGTSAMPADPPGSFLMASPSFT